MATFQDNINTINTAIYGKEMRPAISEALSQSWNAVKMMMNSVDTLNNRIDNLPSGGGGEDPDSPIDPYNPCGVIAGEATLFVNGLVTPLSAAGEAAMF